jgi:putative hydrolase of the HAD superfamily
LIKGAIFDYGDTLVRHSVPFEVVLPVAVRTTYSLFAQAGLETTFEEYEAIDRRIFGMFAEVEGKENRDIPDAAKYGELIRRLFPTRSKAWRSRMATMASRRFYEVGARYRRVGRGAKPSLDKLKSMGLRMVVLSNHSSQEALVQSLRHFKLHSYFLRIYSSSELGVRKPDPKAFTKCLSVLRTRAEETVVVGDSLKNDIAGAKACGMRSVLVDWESTAEIPGGLPAPDFRVATLETIPKVVRQLNVFQT